MKKEVQKVKIINGIEQAASLCKNLKLRADEKKQKYNAVPCLAAILVGNDPASHIYVNNKMKRANELGFSIISHFLDHQTLQDDLLILIAKLNLNPNVHGILLQLPLPKHLDQFKSINAISAIKDVDGFTAQNVGMLNLWQDCFEPSTPQGVLILIKLYLGDDLSGKKAVILGRSVIVGRPMVSMLIRENCTVTLLHSKSLNIEEECRSADILISAIGVPNFVDSSFVKPGACVIDVGITRIEDKIVGDVDFESVSAVAGFITPVPGGVGPMTIACMLSNTYKAMCKQLGFPL